MSGGNLEKMGRPCEKCGRARKKRGAPSVKKYPP